MQPEILFESIDAILVPRLPIAADGTLRQADGKTLLSIAQASEQRKLDPEILERAYEAFLADAMTPDSAGRLADPAAYAAGAAQLRRKNAEEALHRLKFSQLSDQQFADVVIECDQRGLSPWSRHVWADLRHDAYRGVPAVFLGTTVDGLRAVAQRTGRYAGQSAPQFCGRDGRWLDVWLDDAPPLAARATILVAGAPEPTVRIAKWSECAVYQLGKHGEKILDPIWAQRPSHMLAKCAEAFALRAAFPEVLAGLYTREEMGTGEELVVPAAELSTVARRVSAGGGGGRQIVYPNPSASVPLDDDDQVSSEFRFANTLINLGFGRVKQRQTLIQEFKDHHPALYASDRPAFRALVLKTVRGNPARYGADVDAPAPDQPA